jgi:uncharacterized damage-inducible protein DinB
MMFSRQDNMRHVRSSLLEAVADRSDRALDWSSGAPLWGTKQLLTHLGLSEIHFMSEVCRLLGEPPPESGPLLDNGNTLPAEVVLSQLGRIRTSSSRMLAQLQPDQWMTRLTFSSHPLLVNRTVAEVIDFMVWHEARHVVQIKTLLEQAAVVICDDSTK